jgi:predicted MFS family arabinose efflux permease
MPPQRRGDHFRGATRPLPEPPLPGACPHRLLAAMVPLVILSQFFRSSIGVIAPNLMQDLSLSPDDLGLLAGSFFLIFAALQLPIGILLDRYGGRRVLSSMMVLTVGGALAFAAAPGFGLLLAGRLLIGTGCAGLMIGSLTILGRWYAPDRLAMAMAILFASANAGNLIATLPLAAASSVWGWRATFVGLAVLSAALTLVFFAIVRDAPDAHGYHQRRPETLPGAAAGVREVFGSRDLLHLLPMIAIGYASTIAVLGAWGGPFLHEVYGLGEVARGEALSVMAMAMILGTLAYGPLDRRFDTRRGIVVSGAVATIIVLGALALLASAGLRLVTLLLALFAFLSSYSLVVMAHGLALVPEKLAGRGAAALNAALMGGAGLVQTAIGYLMAAYPDRAGGAAAQPYALMFALIAALTGAALIVYCGARDVRPSDHRGGPAAAGKSEAS